MKYLLTLFFLLGVTSIPLSFGEETPSLFTETPFTTFDNLQASRSFSTDDVSSPTNPILYADISIQTSNQLQANLDAFDSDKFRLKIFDKEYVVEKQSVIYRADNDFTWFGNIANSDYGIVTLVVQNKGISAHIQNINSTYMITELTNDNHIIQEIDTSLLSDEADPPHDKNNLLDLQSLSATSSNSIPNITVYAIYTTDAESISTDIERDIQLAIDNANRSYRESNIDVTVELLATAPTSFVEGSTNDDVLALMSTNDGFMDEIHAERDRLAADVVLLFEADYKWRDNPTDPWNFGCGSAIEVNSDEHEAFAVSNVSCISQHTPAHEIGHIQGAGHNTDFIPNFVYTNDNFCTDSNDPPDPDTCYGHGLYYINPTFGQPSWRTIMSYECRDGFFTDCPRQLYWSTPLQETDGVPRGDVTHNNAEVLRLTAEKVSQFRIFPSWLQIIAELWVDNTIVDSEYLNNINYMINEGYLDISADQGSGNASIPSWIKDVAGWWADGTVNDTTYANALTWLIENGIIVLGEYRVSGNTTLSIQSADEPLSIQSLDVFPFQSAYGSSETVITMSSDALDPACSPDCFIPNSININNGDSVRFVNSKPSPTVIASGHPDSGPDGYFNSGPIASGTSYTHTFSDDGTYNYFDLVSPWMQGTIIVGDFTPNNPPTADAGNPQNVDELRLVILDGSDSSDPEGQVLRYSWKQVSGSLVQLSGSSNPGGVSNSVNPSFTAPDVTLSDTLIFQLTVRDDILQPDTDTVSVTVNHVVPPQPNQQPVANAGPDVSFEEGTVVTLDGSGSYDPDAGDTITYKWTQTNGESWIVVEDDPLFDSTAASLQFTSPMIPADRTLQLKLVVTDNHGANSFVDYVTVTVTNIPDPPFNNPPVARIDLINHLGSDLVDIDVLFNDYDDDGDNITIQSVDTTGTAGTVTISADNKSVTFDPTDDTFGETFFSYTITDGEKTDSANVGVTVIDDSGGGDALLFIPNPDLSFDGRMGTAVAQIDDVNDDGIDDILASEDSSSFHANKVFIFDGDVNGDGSVISRLQNPAGAVDDEFGFAIDSSGNNKIYVGAPSHDGSTGRDTGEVYLFDSAGTLQDSLAPSTLSARDNFGTSIITYSDKVAIGVPGYDVTVTESSNVAESTGFSSDTSMTDLTIATDGNSATMQSSSQEEIIIPNTIIYNTLDTTLDLETQELEESVPRVPSFTINNGTIIVYDSANTFGDFTITDSSNPLMLLVDQKTETSYLFDSTNAELLTTTYGNAGAVFVYNVATSNLEFIIENPRPVSGDIFGASLGTINDNLVVGTPGYDVPIDEFNRYWAAGAIYYLDGEDGSEIHFTPNPSVAADKGAADDFGESVGTTASYILVGAPDDGAGAAWIIDPTTGNALHYLPNPTDDGRDMGLSIAGTTNKVIVGEYRNDFVHVYDADTGSLLSTIESPELPAANRFGTSVSALDDDILIGSPSDRIGTTFEGSVYVYSGDIMVTNNAPVANDDSSSVTNVTPIVIGVLANDTDDDGDKLTVDSVNVSGTAGTVTNNGNDITFTADANFDGDTTFSYRATDGIDLSNPATVTVTVTDTAPPVITLLGDDPQLIDVGAGYFELGATTDDGSEITIDSSEFADAVGAYYIYYDSTDVNNNVATQIIRTVNVVDNVPPTITIPENQTFEATSLNTPLTESDYGTATATDNYDDTAGIVISSDASSTFPLGDTEIEWSATDASDNISTAIQTITVQDTIKPDITIIGDNPQIIEVNGVYSELGATASDNIDGNITDDIIIDFTLVDVTTVGTYPVRYDVSDSSNNAALTQFRTISVEDSINELFCGQPESYYNVIEGTNSADHLKGTKKADLIFGYGGNDFIQGRGGDDCIYAGDGNDFIQGSRGNDTIYAGNGDDGIRTGSGSDVIFGGEGNDILIGITGINTLDGGDGEYDICIPQNSRFVPNIASCEVVSLTVTADVIDESELFCGQLASSYDNVIIGTDGADYIMGTNKADLIMGMGGNDMLRGSGGNDCILAGDGNDFVQGGGGDDSVYAGSGDDHIRTGRGTDAIFGGEGNDILLGITGTNTLDGGEGDYDICVPQGSRLVPITTPSCEITS